MYERTIKSPTLTYMIVVTEKNVNCFKGDNFNDQQKVSNTLTFYNAYFQHDIVERMSSIVFDGL